jgi:hypothetical protein
VRHCQTKEAETDRLNQNYYVRTLLYIVTIYPPKKISSISCTIQRLDKFLSKEYSTPMAGRHTMDLYKRFTFFFIILLLASTFVVATHNHADTEDHHECPICVVSHHQPATSQSIVAFEVIPCINETTFVATSQVYTDNLFFFCRKNRAPPA